MGFAAKNTDIDTNLLNSSKLPDTDADDIARITKELIMATSYMPTNLGMSKEDLVLASLYRKLPREICDTFDEYDQKLDQTLTGANLKRLQIEGDGNCLFSSTALLLTKADFSNDYKMYLSSIGINNGQNLEEIANALRQMTVREIQHRYHRYMRYVSNETTMSLKQKIARFMNVFPVCKKRGGMQIKA